MTPYEELCKTIKELHEDGKYIFIIDAVHALCNEDMPHIIDDGQYSLLHFATVEDTFSWLSKLTEECTDDCKNKFTVILYHLERLVVQPVVVNAYMVNTVMRKIMTPNGEIIEQKYATKAKRMLETAIQQAEAAGINLIHIFDVKENPHG